MVLTTEARLELAAQLFLTVNYTRNFICSIFNVLRCIHCGQKPHPFHRMTVVSTNVDLLL